MGIFLLLLLAWTSVAFAEPVRFTQGKCVVPTYSFERVEDVAPLFKSLENMGHYPYTILDWSSRVKKPVPVEYESLVLENDYLRVEFLPEFGGRIWSAFDKTAQRQIFYHPTVVKPGRYNQRGGWPVGNLELYGPFDAHMLTWPGEPWAWALENHPDGSATLTLTHIDHFFRDKVSLAVTIRPGRSFLETSIRLYNKNLLPNRYLLWTNAGVAATEGSRFVYPMTKTIGHDSSALNTWPMIQGQDLSWNKNNKNMLGVFGLDIFDNFMSIYDYKVDYGTICYTNRLLARGMKTWTFGSGLTALRHMAAYTDNDGLYMETQSGRFIWDGNYEFIDPGESDGWTEYWYGAGKLGGLTTATRDIAISFEAPVERPAAARLAVTATGSFPQSILELWIGKEKVWSTSQDLDVRTVFQASISLPQNSSKETLNLRIRSQNGQPLLNHLMRADGAHPEAEYASDSIPRKFGPMETLPIEEIYQKGLGHEKFGQITEAEEAYRMALSKDALFSPAHLRLGLLAMDRFANSEAFPRFQKVLERDPTNGDAHYFLGLIEAERGRIREAKRHSFRILPSSAKYKRRDFMLGLLALQEGNWEEASPTLARAAVAAPLDLAIRQANAYQLRKSGSPAEAQQERKAIVGLDPTNAFARSEQLFADHQAGNTPSGVPSLTSLQSLDQACAGHSQGYLELATEYMRLSAWEEAGKVLDRGIETAKASGKIPYPLLYYYRAYVAGLEGNKPVVSASFTAVHRQELRLDIFPFRYEDMQVLTHALKVEPGDANAAVLLGDLLYSRSRRQEAIDIWRKALTADPRHFFALRDLGMALLAKGEGQEGLELVTRASLVRPDHLATTMLVTNLNARLGNADAARKAIQRALDKNPERDVLVEKLASVEAQMGNEAQALELLRKHTFEPTHQIYSLLHLYRGIRLLRALDAYRRQNLPEALTHIGAAAQPPSNLGIDDFAAVQSSRLLLFEALLHQSAGHSAEAQKAWQAAAATRDDDIEGEGLFRAIALHKVGQTQIAKEWLNSFRTVNEQRKSDNAVDLRLQAHCLSGFHAAFEGKEEEAAESFRRAMEIDQSYLYARQALAWLQSGLLKGLRP